MLKSSGLTHVAVAVNCGESQQPLNHKWYHVNASVTLKPVFISPQSVISHLINEKMRQNSG